MIWLIPTLWRGIKSHPGDLAAAHTPSPAPDSASMLQEILDSPLLIGRRRLRIIGLLLLASARIAALLTIGRSSSSAACCSGWSSSPWAPAPAWSRWGPRAIAPFDTGEVAARLSMRPTGPQRFTATVQFPDGRSKTFEMAGDEVYIDAHILKWRRC
jgi:hypothetical protein